MKENLSKIWQKIKYFSLEVFAFLTSKVFIKNFAGVIGMLIVLFFFTTTWLKCYTNHGEAIHMTNYVGKNLLDVKNEAKKKGFQIVVDSIPSSDVNKNFPALTVLDQDPKPDALVKEKRTVYLAVKKAGFEYVELPQLDGSNESFSLYKKQLEQRNIIYTYKDKLDSRVAENTILDVFYKDEKITDDVRDGKFKKIPTFSKTPITIVISKKGYGNTNVPNIVCKTLSEAKLILENSNLTINFEADQTVVDKDNAFVWLQNPAAGSSIRFGEQVRLRLTQNLPDDCDDAINELEAPGQEEEEDN
ncbi:MAG: PASTA domain-containing protein [Saprospiraceae bacterium]